MTRGVWGYEKLIVSELQFEHLNEKVTSSNFKTKSVQQCGPEKSLDKSLL